MTFHPHDPAPERASAVRTSRESPATRVEVPRLPAQELLGMGQTVGFLGALAVAFLGALGLRFVLRAMSS